MSTENYLIDRALAIVAGTKNYNSGDQESAGHVLRIYQELKSMKQKNNSALAHDIYRMLEEALICKKVPESDVKAYLKSLNLNQVCIDSKKNKPISVFCFPFAGGESSFYKNWNKLVDKNIGIIPVEYPGHGLRSKEKIIHSFHELLNDLEYQIEGKLDKDFFFFGHSLGAMTAYELSRRLIKKNKKKPIALFLSACPAPHLIKKLSSTSGLNDSDFLKKVQELNGTAEDLVKADLFSSYFLPIIRTDFALMEDYVAEHDLHYDIPLKLFGGLNDKHVSLDDIQKWKEITRGQCHLSSFEGDHFYIKQPQNMLKVLSEHIAVIMGKSYV